MTRGLRNYYGLRLISSSTPSCAKTRSIELRGLAIIELEQSAEALTTCDGTCSDHGCRGHDKFIAQTLVRTFFMIMTDKCSDGRAEVRFAEEHHPLQAFRLGRLDKSFGKRVQIGTPRREDHWRHATVAQQAPKRRGVETICRAARIAARGAWVATVKLLSRITLLKGANHDSHDPT